VGCALSKPRVGSPKGRDSAVAALQAARFSRSPEPRALPWAKDSQPFGLKTEEPTKHPH